MPKNLTTFNTASALLLNDDGTLQKEALLFYESADKPHKDSKGKEWVVDENMIWDLEEGTNDYLNRNRIPIFKDHRHTSENEIGELVDGVVAREITPEDAARNPKIKHLIGRLGLFTDGLVYKDPEVVGKIKQGLNKAISVGVDFVDGIIKEVSNVGFAALSGCSLFSKTGAYTSLEEAIKAKEQDEESREELHELLDLFIDVYTSIKDLDDTQLFGEDKTKHHLKNYEQFIEKMQEKLPIEDPNATLYKGYNDTSAVKTTYSSPNMNLVLFNRKLRHIRQLQQNRNVIKRIKGV
jgi:hypothetical protein